MKYSTVNFIIMCPFEDCFVLLKSVKLLPTDESSDESSLPIDEYTSKSRLPVRNMLASHESVYLAPGSLL